MVFVYNAAGLLQVFVLSTNVASPATEKTSTTATDQNEDLKSNQSETVDEYSDAERNFQPKSLKFWAIILGMYMSIFLVALDRTIIATAIPKITDEFNSISDIAWYGSAYMLTCACFNPISGRVYQLYSTKWVFLSCIVVFEVGSVICGAAPSSAVFIVGRAVAGAGAAGIFSGGMMIILPLIPLRKRPVFTSLFGLAFGVSSVLGPIIGGVFTDQVSWRWCFYINLPIGGCTFLAILFFLHIESPKRDKLSLFAQIRRLDALGIVFFVPSMVCLILVLQWGGSSYAWSSTTIIGLLVACAVLFVSFIVVEVRTPETAMAPTRVILNRSIAGSMLFMFLLSGGLMSVIYYLTIWFQAVKGVSALQSGINTIPVVLCLVVFGIIAAIFTEKIGYYVPAMLVSPIFCAIGAGLLSTLSPATNQSKWIGFQVLYGVGIGFGFQSSNLASQTVLPRVDVPLGMALMFFMQQMGGAIFLAIAQAIFSARLIDRLSGIADLGTEAIINTGVTDLRNSVPAKNLAAVVDAYSFSLTRIFVMTAALSACTIIGALALEWKSIRGGKEAQKTEAGLEEGRSEKESKTSEKP